MGRICNQCKTEMVDDCGIKLDLRFDDVIITKKFKGIFNNKHAKLKAAVCTNCGNVTIYTEDYKQFINL